VLLLACQRQDLIPIIGFIKTILMVIQILIPIGLIVLGTIDLGKAVIASKEDEIKKNQQILIKRAIAAVLVFLLATIVTFLMSFVGGKTWTDCWIEGSCPSGVDPITGKCL
jgi:hypothetical protein